MEDASCMSLGTEMEYWSSLGKVIMFGLQLHGKGYIACSREIMLGQQRDDPSANEKAMDLALLNSTGNLP